MPPRVSIVVPMYNAQHYLSAAIDSIRDQTVADWEAVLSDDGSRDQTLAIASDYARRDPRIHVVANPNGGTARARNRGFAATSPSSEFVIFLDNDDVWEPDALEVLTRALDEHPECPAAHGLACSIDPAGHQPVDDNLADEMLRRLQLRNGVVTDLPRLGPTTFEALLVKNHPLTPGTTMVRRTVMERVGGFLPETVPCDDWDMNLRIARHGGIVLVDKVILQWRRHPGAASHNTGRWRSAYLRVRRRSVRWHTNTAIQRSAALAAFRLDCRIDWRFIARDLGLGHFADTGRTLARLGLIQISYWVTAWQASRGYGPIPRADLHVQLP